MAVGAAIPLQDTVIDPPGAIVVGLAVISGPLAAVTENGALLAKSEYRSFEKSRISYAPDGRVDGMKNEHEPEALPSPAVLEQLV